VYQWKQGILNLVLFIYGQTVQFPFKYDRVNFYL